MFLFTTTEKKFFLLRFFSNQFDSFSESCSKCKWILLNPLSTQFFFVWCDHELELKSKESDEEKRWLRFKWNFIGDRFTLSANPFNVWLPCKIFHPFRRRRHSLLLLLLRWTIETMQCNLHHHPHHHSTIPYRVYRWMVANDKAMAARRQGRRTHPPPSPPTSQGWLKNSSRKSMCWSHEKMRRNFGVNIV